MAKVFLKAYKNVILNIGQLMIFEFHGQNLRLRITGLSPIDLPKQPSQSVSPINIGVVMENTDITFVKAADSNLKLKSSAKK